MQEQRDSGEAHRLRRSAARPVGVRSAGSFAALALAFAAVMVPATAGADGLAPEPWWSPQAETINAEFLSNPALPPPEAVGGEQTAVCVVDTGVGSPAGVPDDLRDAVVSRLSVFPDDQGGDDRGGVATTEHGTQVASVIASHTPTGGNGIWRHAKIVSVRVFPGDGGAARAEDYREVLRSALYCRRDPRVRAINISIAEYGEVGAARAISGAESEFLAIAETSATLLDDGWRFGDGTVRTVSVVAAAGNRAQASADRPALTPVSPLPDELGSAPLGVGGVMAAGSLCGFSNFGEGVDLLAQGCGARTSALGAHSLDGTSFAAPAVATVIAALRAYAPGLSARAAAALVMESARVTAAGRLVDAEAAFTAAGLSALVRAAQPPPLGGGPEVTPSSAALAIPGVRGTQRGTCASGQRARPSARLRILDGQLRIQLRCRRPARSLVVTFFAREAHRRRTRFGASHLIRARGTARVTVPPRWSRVTLRYRGAGAITTARRALAGGREAIAE